MTDVEASYEDFVASRRSGRRNAVHELPAAPGAQGPADLSQTLAQLNKSGDEGEDTKKSQDSTAKEEETQAEGS